VYNITLFSLSVESCPARQAAVRFSMTGNGQIWGNVQDSLLNLTEKLLRPV